MRERGTVVNFDLSTGVGFIRPLSGPATCARRYHSPENLVFRAEDLQVFPHQRETITEGTLVEFGRMSTATGAPRAARITLV